uniref:Uncharacterized protein LOC114333878 n=1 Tax=Diabrotica virgifera virgifera TaxID=50390 RepID=A0A6P7G3T0_DIAVI
MDEEADDFYLMENSCLKYMLLKKKKQYWVNDLYIRRDEEGEYVTLFEPLKKQPTKFFEYFRMSPLTFEYLLEKLHSRLEKYSNFRKCIEPEQKLMVTLRFLSTGLSFRSLAFSFRMAHSTVRNIIYEVCEAEAIWDEFHKQHMPLPTTKTHEVVAEDFFVKWNFPNCIGCIDGKHIRLRCPPMSGSLYWNYKQYYSIVLQGVADAHCRFLYIDVGSYGKQSDGGIFAASTLKQCLDNKIFYIPKEKAIPRTNINAPYN